jgi:prolyl 4-hydroxylase
VSFKWDLTSKAQNFYHCIDLIPAVNITMEPGEMVLYESGSLIHGRPFPLVGRSYANIFIHFEPTGRALHDPTDDYLEKMDDFYPPYLVPHSLEYEHWAERNPKGWRPEKYPVPSGYIQQIHTPEAHVAAATGDIYRLHKVAKHDKEALYQKDVNGWQPVHEAARAGHTDVVKLLIQHGVEKDARTGRFGDGDSVLTLAVEYLGENHDLVYNLRSIGVTNYAQSEL